MEKTIEAGVLAAPDGHGRPAGSRTRKMVRSDRLVPTIDFIYFDAGGGHRAAATALQLAIERQQRPWNVRLVHLKDILDSIDVFRKVTRIDLQEIYNLMLRKGWTLGSEQGLRFMQTIIRMWHRAEVRLLERHWREQPADMVVSLIPNFNRALFDGFSAACPGKPYVTILTDLADFPPRFWIEHGQKQHIICGTPWAVEQAHALGHAPSRVHPTSGMILNPRFYDLPEIDRAEERRKLGLDPDIPTACVMFGGYGAPVMRDILTRLNDAKLRLQLILIAGRNEALKQNLESTRTSLKKCVIGFTTDVPHYMRISDFFIGKPGPGSLSEALHLGLPAITVRNAWTLPQERYNAEWLLQNQTGLVLRSFSGIVPAVRTMLSGTTLEFMRGNAAAMNNQAVWEVPEILSRIL